MFRLYFRLLKNFLVFLDEYKKSFEKLNINSDILFQDLFDILKNGLSVLENEKKYKIIKLISLLIKIKEESSFKDFYKGEVIGLKIRCEERKLMSVKCIKSGVKVFFPLSDNFDYVEIKVRFLF